MITAVRRPTDLSSAERHQEIASILAPGVLRMRLPVQTAQPKNLLGAMAR